MSDVSNDTVMIYGSTLAPTVARTLAVRFGEFNNVKDYGAVLDGSTSDSTAFQNIYNLTPNNGSIVIPQGGLDASFTSASGAVFDGNISGTTLTISSVTSGTGTPAYGTELSSTAILPGTAIESQGTFGVGTFAVTPSQTVALGTVYASSTSSPGAVFVGGISGTSLTISSVTSGLGNLVYNNEISGNMILTGTTIDGLGTFGVGTFTVNNSQTIAAGTTITASPATIPRTVFVGNISGTTLTIQSVTSGLNNPYYNNTLSSGLPGTYIVSPGATFASGGTYSINNSQTLAAGTNFVAVDKSVLWQTLGSFDYGSAPAGTNPVVHWGDGDVFETYFGGRKVFQKTTTNSQSVYATVEVDLTMNNASSLADGSVASSLTVKGSNNTPAGTNRGAGVWSVNAFCTVKNSASDNYAIAGTTTIESTATGWGGCQYLQLFDNAGTSGAINVTEHDLNVPNADPISSDGPRSGRRAIASWKVVVNPQVTGATVGQASRGLEVSGAGGAAIGAVFYSGGNIYYAGLDVCQATFLNTSTAAVRIGPNMPIDLSGNPTTGSLNKNTILYNSSTTNFEYQVSGAAVFSIGTIGSVTGAYFRAAPPSADIAFGVTGTTGAVGFDTSGSTLTDAAFRMAGGQFFALEGSSTYKIMLNGTTTQIMNGTTINFAVDDAGNVTALGDVSAGANIAGVNGTFSGTAKFTASGSTLGTIQANGTNFINYTGSSTVGINLSGGTYSQNVIRIGANQSLAWENTGTIKTLYSSGSSAWQFENGGTVELQVSTGSGTSWFSGNVGVGGSSGPYWRSGTGAPTYSAPRGSMYSRADGAVGSTLYVSQGSGTWNPVSGV